MKTPIVLLLCLFFFTPPALAQARVFNQNSYNLSLVYKGESFSILADEADIWQNAPQGEFVAYLYRQIADCPALYIEKIGFVLLKNDQNLLIIKENLQPLPVYLSNLSSEEIVVEYGKWAIFLPPGRTTLLRDIFLNTAATAAILVSKYRNKTLSLPQSVIIQFELKENSFRAIWE